MSEKTIYAAYEEIKQREIRELKNKLNAIGGSYVFRKIKPCVLCNFDSEYGPSDVVVTEAEVSNGNLVITGYLKDTFSDEFRIDVSEIAYGHIDFITSAVPEPELSDKMRLLCETVAMLSADLFDSINERLPDHTAVCEEIVRLAQKFEYELDWEHTSETKDYLDELDRFENEYLKSIEED